MIAEGRVPARAVVVSSFTKFDGVNFATLTTGELTQLMGRAGRRGIDTIGHGVILKEADVEIGTIYEVALGEGLVVESKFLPNYNMALNLLRAPRVVWLVPGLGPPGASGGQKTLTQLIPLPVYLVVIQLCLAVVLAALWRARRLGPLVPERLPVVVRASETVEGHARLYQARRARDRAAAALRAAMLARTLPTLGLAPGAGPGEIVPALSARSAGGAARIEAMLFGPAPGDDASLVALAHDLDALEREVRTP